MKKGFTLVELIIVIAVMAIIAAIAAPSYQTYMKSRRLKGAARQVMTHLMEARMKAVSINERVKVSFESNHEYEMWNDADRNGTVADNEGDDIERDLYPDYYDVTFSATADPVFQSNGTATGSTITFTNGSDTQTVSVSTAGRVKIN